MLEGATGRLSLLRRNRGFALLFWSTAGSAIGTYLAALALAVHVFDLTGSGPVASPALLIADFLPMVVIGLTLGPLVDRLSRRRLMVVSDLVRAATFVALPFVDRPGVIVALAMVNGVATGFFRPAVWGRTCRPRGRGRARGGDVAARQRRARRLDRRPPPGGVLLATSGTGLAG